MSRFIETIRADHGVISPLRYHQERVNETLSHWGCTLAIDLAYELKMVPIPGYPITKIRVVYGLQGIEEIECLPYAMKHINSMKMVHADDVSYSYKFLERQWITDLIKSVDTDDIIMVKHGMITDASYANLAFCRNDRWYTPSHSLLKGTRRAALLDQGLLTETIIDVKNVQQYSHIKLINAMMHWEESPMLEISKVMF